MTLLKNPSLSHHYRQTKYEDLKVSGHSLLLLQRQVDMMYEWIREKGRYLNRKLFGSKIASDNKRRRRKGDGGSEYSGGGERDIRHVSG